MRSDRSGERLECPHCHANNFAGQAQCWQCRGSLPPPEEIKSKGLKVGSRQANAGRVVGGTQEQSYSAPAAPYILPAASHSPGKMPLVLCIALLTAGTLVWVGTRHRDVTPGAPALNAGESAEMRGLRNDARGVVPESELSNSGLPDPGGARLSMPQRDPLAAGTDPNEIAAKRAIEQAMPHLGLPPSSGSDGKVHLRNGDTISSEQYEDVQRKLRQNPVLGNHTPVPRL